MVDDGFFANVFGMRKCERFVERLVVALMVLALVRLALLSLTFYSYGFYIQCLYSIDYYMPFFLLFTLLI